MESKYGMSSEGQANQRWSLFMAGAVTGVIGGNHPLTLPKKLELGASNLPAHAEPARNRDA